MSFSIDEVMADWKEDAKVSRVTLKDDIYRSPMLHAKYLEVFVYFKARKDNAEKKYNLMLWQKRKYWRGEMEKHELEKFGWSQWNGLKPTGSELNFLVDADRDLNDLKLTVEQYKTAVQAMEYIMKAIGSRDYVMKTIVDYEKFMAGG